MNPMKPQCSCGEGFPDGEFWFVIDEHDDGCPVRQWLAHDTRRAWPAELAPMTPEQIREELRSSLLHLMAGVSARELWSMILGGDRSYGMGAVTIDTLQRIRRLSAYLGEWYELGEWVPLGEWEERYQGPKDRAEVA